MGMTDCRSGNTIKKFEGIDIKMLNEEDKRSLPLGFGMALAQNTEALYHFAALSKIQQQQVIEHTKTVNSKSEMQQYVKQIAENPSAFY